jgi:1,6-anhydro-N-acetylmuramate kinase
VRAVEVGGRRNGLLLREIKHRLPGVQVCLIEDLGIQSEDLSPAAIAGLTFLHIDQVPVSPTSGTEAPRILGRLTPGSPTNWHRLLREMTRHVPPKMTLRSAI